jgi:hypothetical protein
MKKGKGQSKIKKIKKESKKDEGLSFVNRVGAY